MSEHPEIYTTLSTPLREIRLLQILPDSDPGGLKCTLSVHFLEGPETVPYTALSYVWGQEDPSGRHAVILNGHKKPVTPNLLQALQSFYKLGHVGYLWADAICINQSDLEEKSSQVSMMDTIYASAAKTIVWLGPSEDDSDAAMDFVANLQEGDLAVPEFNAELRRGLLAATKLMQRPWWTRTWILQEAFLSRNLVARCGAKEVPFTRFVSLKKQTSETYWSMQGKWRGIPLFDRVPFASCLSNWDVTKSELSSPKRSSLFSWIISMSDKLDATERRDKVFAILGMVSDEDRAVIRPDYKRPMRDILIDVTLQSIRSEGLMFLNVVEPQDMKPSDLDLPSWVPFLIGGHSTQNLVGYKPRFGAHLSGDSTTWAKLFRDSGINASNPKSVLSENREHAGMFLDGIEVDEVIFADPMPHVPEYRGHDELVAARVKAQRVRSTIDTIKMWEPRALQEPPEPGTGCYKDLGGREEAFWRTLACDGSATRVRPLPPDCGHRLNAFLGKCPPPGREDLLDETIQDDGVREYAVPVVAKTMHRSFILTRKGRMGLAVRGVANGDLVVIAKDSNVPLVVRRHEIYGFAFIGEAYVHGIMDGEAVAQASEQGVKAQKICLR
jgi:hypothetical protein